MVFLEKLFKKHEDYTEQITKARQWILEADAIAVYIGSGLSAAGGLDDKKSRLVKEYFRDYYRMGYRSLKELQEMYAHMTEQNAKAYWGYWARYIKEIAYQFELSNGYKDLLRLMRNREYFICTTNIDGQVQKAGFEANRIWSLKGDCRFLKCSQACCPKAYESKELLDGIIKSMGGNLEVQANKIPRCPHCGMYLIPDVEMDCLVESIGDSQGQLEAYKRFIEKHKNEKIVLLELGIESRDLIQLASRDDRVWGETSCVQLVKMNNSKDYLKGESYNESANKLKDEMISIKMDLEEAMSQLASGIISM